MEHPASNADFWVAVLRIATPLIFGTLGVLLCERAGVLNLGIEGIMVAGALTGWLVVYLGAGLWIGVLAAALTGAAFGLLHAFLTVPLALSQHVVGPRHHAVRDERRVLRVSRELSQRDRAADHPAVHRDDVAADSDPRAADADDAARARVRRARRAGSSIARRSGSPCARSARIPPPPKDRD